VSWKNELDKQKSDSMGKAILSQLHAFNIPRKFTFAAASDFPVFVFFSAFFLALAAMH